jgi:DNA-binding CsgD family transcriptional regulator
MAARREIGWLAREVEEVGRRGLPLGLYLAEVAARLRRVVDVDAFCWHTLDPATLLLTSAAPDELVSAGVFAPAGVAAAGGRIVEDEYAGDGVNSFAALARRRVPVGILSHTARGRPEGVARHRDLLVPWGIPFEMRAAFVSRGRAWGAVHVARREATGDFTPADATALANVAPLVADGIRASLRFDAARREGGDGAPGMVVIGPDDAIEMITTPARELLAALRAPAERVDAETPPTPVLALASHCRAARAGAASCDVVAVPSAIGWITLHATLPEGRADGRVAVVLERAPTRQATAVRLETHGVSPREREVAALLARGLSNGEIADALVVSPYTVQDHVRSLYEKTGVSGRQELVARLFLDDYMPRIARRAAPSSDGGFDGPAAVPPRSS